MGVRIRRDIHIRRLLFYRRRPRHWFLEKELPSRLSMPLFPLSLSLCQFFSGCFILIFLFGGHTIPSCSSSSFRPFLVSSTSTTTKHCITSQLNSQIPSSPLHTYISINHARHTFCSLPVPFPPLLHHITSSYHSSSHLTSPNCTLSLSPISRLPHYPSRSPVLISDFTHFPRRKKKNTIPCYKHCRSLHHF